MCVSEEGGREGGGGGRGADTELKTKTPHVNVGNYRYMKYAQMQTDAFGEFCEEHVSISMRQPRFHLSTANRLPSRTVSDLCFRTRLERLLYAF